MCARRHEDAEIHDNVSWCRNGHISDQLASPPVKSWDRWAASSGLAALDEKGCERAADETLKRAEP
jgi:hypothetical protein